MTLGNISPIAILRILFFAWHWGIFLMDSFVSAAVLSSLGTASGQRHNIQA